MSDNNLPLSPAQIVSLLKLEPLVFEGGFFRRVYESVDLWQPLPGDIRPLRPTASAIYYLITVDNFSALHRVRSDECFHFYLGDSVELIQIDGQKKLKKLLLGGNLSAGERPQLTVPKNNWQGLRVKEGGSWALLGATVSPAFAYEDFEIERRETLVMECPDLEQEILRFTRPEEKIT